MREKDIKDILKSKFQLVEDKIFPDQWKSLLSLFFKKIDYFSHPENLFTENDKVIDGKQIGTIKLDDGKQLAVFTVEVSDSISIIRNRQGLREIAAKHIDQNIIHGSLAFFYNKKQADYRFSFIAKEASLDLETGELIKGETKPKRYTYLLGANEACTTPAKRMLVLADKKEKGAVDIYNLKEVFSVEALNRDFFKTYKAHYEKFWKHLADEENPFRAKLIDAEKEDKVKQEKPIRDFAKKLLGRIVFLHFLQKKGWMGCSPKTKDWIDGEPRFMQNLFEKFSKPSNFHSQCLTKLFFETLNSKRTNDIFEVKGLNGKLNGARVPYLNGGLFEQEKNRATLILDFPADFFKELLEFFEQYNFTIDENSPDDHEVGIDPEMLGHIFENLLEDNRDKGAFYTPKEIVQYMCKESLIQYLLNTFQEQKDIEAFIRFNTVSTLLAEKENAVLLNKKLDDIKVCDPAIGSGAFPIGMLQEIFEAKRFIYPYLKTNKDFKPAEVKKNIIQNSIYGVDLEKGAVDIAQLRFWLSLVVDELNPHPLPNLDYKIMQGNSLLEHFEGIELGNAALFNEPDVKIYQASIFEEPKADYGFSKENRTNIKDLIDDYFKVEEKTQKTAIHKQIDTIVMEHIDKSLEFFENKLLIEIATYEYQLSSKTERLTQTQKEQYLEKSKELKEIEKRQSQLQSKTAARKRLLDFENTDERPYFLWQLYFMDVFEKGGFDVMIGNPPYIQLQKMGKETDILQDAGFDTFARTGDIYCLFYEKGIDLLKKESGVLSYITSNSWMKTKYGQPLRKFFVEKTNPIKLLNFEDTQIFPSATVEVNILIAKKQLNSKKTESVALKQDSIKRTIQQYFEENNIQLDNLDNTEWIILSKSDHLIKKEIEDASIPLNSFNLQISRGIITGLNDAFIISDPEKIEIQKSDANIEVILKKFLGGRDIHKYKVEWNNEWLIYSHSGVNEKDFPNLIEHLSPFKDKLEARRGGMNPKTGEVPYKWWQLQVDYYSSGTFRNYELPKIMWAELSDKQKFTFDNTGIYPNKTIFIITGDLIKPLLTVLNSKVTLWFFNQTSTTSGMGTTIWSKYKVEQLPIPKSLVDYSVLFEIIADYLIYLNDPKQETILEKASNETVSQVFEDLVNMMVYELYFSEEMKAKEIDVLAFVTEKAFPDITKSEDKKGTIQKVYYELQQKDNPIRNRILVASSRSETIARINAATS